MQDTKENRIKFASLMGKLGVAYRVDSNKEMMSVFWEFLQDRSMYQVENAIIDIIKTGERFPTVAKIREIAGSYREFKTREMTPPAFQITEFTSAEMQDYSVPDAADEFFKKMLGECCDEVSIKQEA